ncbi:MAG: T9SS type A sorting domain-containing protein [Bacteroidia bacterium]
MKYFRKLLSITLLILSCQFSWSQNWANERTVQVRAEVQSSPAEITLHWEASTYATSYSIFRRLVGETDWKNTIVTLTATDSTWTDNNVSTNVAYEYLIQRETNLTEPFGGGEDMVTNSTLISGIEIATQHQRGKVLLLIDEELADSISPELHELRMDLIGDGWESIVVEIADTATAIQVKDIIDNTADIDVVYILGNVVYPYSGIYCRPGVNYETPPDGHKEDAGGHCGAWIADVYYGSIDSGWTDSDSLISWAVREDNKNRIGDGKFDNMQIPSKVVIQVGRTDLSRLPTIGGTEISRMKAYLAKVHNYKIDATPMLREAVMENNFSGSREGFSAGAIRDFYNHLGPGKTTHADLFTTTAGNNYLFSYVTGPGSYTSCGGVGNTASFVSSNPGMFAHMFGSYFGDVDINNNMLRASLAAQQGGLVAFWSGRPKWLTHGLALGENIGLSAVRTQNNDWDYDVSFFQNYAHVSLLGDPTLRSSMFAPPTNIVVSMNNDSTQVYLDWTASTASDVIGYYVYWSNDQLSGYKLLNQTPIAGTSFAHFTPLGDNNYYMVRAERLETTASGSYYNLSQASHVEVQGVKRTASEKQFTKQEFNLYPIPAQDFIYFRTSSNEILDGQIYNKLGQEVLKDIHIGNNLRLNVSSLPAGVYFLKSATTEQRFIKL